MKVTFNHPKSLHGYPVILDDRGRLMNETEGRDEILSRTGTSLAELAALCDLSLSALLKYGAKSRHPAHVLNMLGLILEVGCRALPMPRRTPEQRRIVDMHDRQGMTFEQIAQANGYSRSRAHIAYDEAKARRA